MILVNGHIGTQIDISDRGLQYGDGVFETLVFRANTVEFLEAHLARLQQGCARLAITFNAWPQLRAELQQVCDTLEGQQAVIKIIITRGRGTRGYRIVEDRRATRIISTHPMPVYPVTYSEQGICIRICQHRLSVNPALAGIKHLNRLDQVLARNEWQDTEIAEGIMLDQQDNVIEGTMSNLFMINAGRLLTPSLRLAGIAGIIRQRIIQWATAQSIPVEETVMTVSDLLKADEIFMCNSVIGIWPVSRIIDEDAVYLPGRITRACQTWLKQVEHTCAG